MGSDYAWPEGTLAENMSERTHVQDTILEGEIYGQISINLFWALVNVIGVSGLWP